MANLRAIKFDMEPMGIDPNQQIRAHLTISAGDQGPFTLTLRGNFPPVTATIRETPFGAEIPVPVQQTAEGIELELDLTAQHDLTITP
jgi:hypothetical protein